MPVVVKATCPIIDYIYDYTTKSRMDMVLDTPITELINQFLKDTLERDGSNNIISNPCNVDLSCISNEILIPPITVTPKGCPLLLTNVIYIASPIFHANMGFIASFIGNNGAVSFFWSFPTSNDPLTHCVFKFKTGSVATDAVPIIVYDPIYPAILQTIQYITCTITDSIGCVSTKRFAFIVDGVALTYAIDFVNNYVNVVWALVFVAKSSTTLRYIVNPVDYYTYTIQVIALSTGIVVYSTYGQPISKTIPILNLSGLVSGESYNTTVTRIEADGTTTSHSDIQTLP